MREFMVMIRPGDLVEKINRLGFIVPMTAKEKNAVLHYIRDIKSNALFSVSDGRILNCFRDLQLKTNFPVVELTGKERQRIFFDMDGVLAEYNPDATPEDLVSDDYFANRPVMQHVRDSVWLLKMDGIYDVYILSCSDGTKNGKNAWLKREMPFMDTDHILYAPIGHKQETVPFPRATDILVDDYNVNLNTWHGIPVKMLNGINSPWKGAMVSSAMDPVRIAGNIMRAADPQCTLQAAG